MWHFTSTYYLNPQPLPCTEYILIISYFNSINKHGTSPTLIASTSMSCILLLQHQSYLECLHWLLHLAYHYGLPLGILPHLYLSKVPWYLGIFGIYTYYLDSFTDHRLGVLYLGTCPHSDPPILLCDFGLFHTQLSLELFNTQAISFSFTTSTFEVFADAIAHPLPQQV